MDAYEATRIVFSRIQNLDPENASKIMGLLLIQDHGEKEMIRLAFGPESLVHSVILKARKELGISSNTPSSTPSTPSSPSPFFSSNPAISLSRQNSSSSSRLGGGVGGVVSGGVGGGISLPSSLSIPNPNSSSGSSANSWAAASGFSNFQTPDDLISPHNNGISNFSAVNSSSPSMNSSSPYYGGSELIDEFQLQDQLSFLNEGPKSPELFYQQQELASSQNGNCGGGGDAMFLPPYGDWGGGGGGGGGSVNGLSHRRSCSVSDICLGSDDSVSGFGWKPCLYFARGYCKNGTSCRFLHGGPTDPAAMVGSPSKLEMMEQCEELLRSKSAHQQQQQRLAAASQLMNSASFPYSASKCMNFLLQHQQNDTQRAAAALMMGEEMHKFGRSRLDRNHFPMNGAVDMNPGSRQIYLTFPADSTFREEDVSNYFSIYGPVQDVRIPYQQKRMFGFVTFVYPETVKIILAKGNPHFVCDARVLVKPYKEKGKVPDKYRKQQQQVERGEYSACNSPTGLDARETYDLPLGPRMFYNTQDMLWRRKLEEQADLQQALELQSRRLMSLQLLDVKKHHHHRALSAGGAPIGSPIQSPSYFNQSPFLHSDRSSSGSPPENCSSPATAFSDQQLQQTVNVAIEKESTGIDENGNGNGKEIPHNEDSDLLESLEHNLPDSPFASPTKAAGEYFSAFSSVSGEVVEKNTAAANGGISAATSVNNNLITSSLLPATSTLGDVASFSSCYFQMPRFSSGHGAIGM